MILNKFSYGEMKRTITTIIFVTLFCIARPAAAGSASGVINFSAVFVGGTCDISASVSEIIFGGGELIAPVDIVNAPPQTSFDLTLNNCSGSGLTPKITVTGDSTTLFGPALFRSPMPASASDGYGILLSTPGNSNFSGNENLAATKVILAKNWNVNNELSGIDITLPVTATLTCGTCDYIYRQSGDLIASVTFDFVYD